MDNGEGRRYGGGRGTEGWGHYGGSGRAGRSRQGTKGGDGTGVGDGERVTAGRGRGGVGIREGGPGTSRYGGGKAEVKNITVDTSAPARDGVPMKTLVVYYSRTGSTKTVASSLAERLGADLEEIVDKTHRKGPVGWLRSAKDGATGKLTVIGGIRYNPSDYDMVIIGTPVWAGRLSPAVRTYLTGRVDSPPRVAFFLTASGEDVGPALLDMRQTAGAEPVAELTLTTKEIRNGAMGAKVEEFMARLTGGAGETGGAT